MSMPPEDELDEIAGLAAEFPEWNFAARWQMAGSGPDGRLLVAWRGDVTVSAPDAGSLRRKIRGAAR